MRLPEGGAEYRGAQPVAPAPASRIVHVAVGRSAAKTLALLRWTFQQFGCEEVGLVHVHQPSPTIPTLLGKLPAKRANAETVAAYRREERREMEKMLHNYRSVCHKAKVQPKLIVTEAAHVERGIVDLITRYGIRKLVMGATSDACFKIKGRSSKVTYTGQNIPPSCEIWFVSKGKHIWTRDPSDSVDECVPLVVSDETILTERQQSSEQLSGGSTPRLKDFSLDPLTTMQVQVSERNRLLVPNTKELVASTSAASLNPACENNVASLPCEESSELRSQGHEELGPEGFNSLFQEVMVEIEMLKTEASTERARCEDLESSIAGSLKRVKAFEAASADEARTRAQLEDMLEITKMQRDELQYERDEATRELKYVKCSVALLEDHGKTMARRCEEAAQELEFIRSSIGNILLEKQNISDRRKKTVLLNERWTHTMTTSSPSYNWLLGHVKSSDNFSEFSALDLHTATCGFSESFKLGQGSYECVYKGEISNRTVVIKKLHPHNVQGQEEFQQEVLVLSKLRHPHLLHLVGVCPELLTLVYEYLPNGSLYECLFCKATRTQLTRRVRAKIVAEIASALLFLHSSKPEGVIHGNLKLENIFLDSDLNCKIGDFSVCRFVPEDQRNYPVFRCNIEPKGAFPYMDPEYQRTGVPTPKSDVYSFGIIILQLLTGKPPLQLSSEVRRAILSEKLTLILDTTAGQWPGEAANRLAEVGLQCSQMNSRDRPDLTPELVRDLQQLYQMERPIPNIFLCPILKEIMNDPHVAADGCTYEGSALREWLENGRGTSPMTNLKLDHLRLIPNHALRFAIHDWLCQPCQQ